MRERFQKVDGKEINENDLLEEDLTLDSLDKIDLWLEIEERYQIDVPESAITPVKRVSDIIDLACSYMKVDK